MKELRVAIVGAGFIGMQHADAIMRQPGAKLVALADADSAGLARKQAQLGLKRGYTDYQQMLEKEDIDIVHNCTPNSLHFAVSQAALSAGVHVYCEKPLAVSVEEGGKLTQMAREKKLGNAVNFNYRGNVCLWEMRERLKKDAGRCFLLHGAYLQDWLMYETDYNWRLEECGNGLAPRALADIGSHWFDLAQFVRGKRITAVNAALFNVWPERVKPSGDRVPVRSEDGAVVQMKFEDGLLASLVLSQVSAGYKNHIALSADCERYSMRWQQQQPDKLVLGKRDGGEEVLYADAGWLSGAAGKHASLPNGHSGGWADALRNMIGEFYQAIRDGSAQRGEPGNYATFEDGLYIMRLAEACAASWREQKWRELSNYSKKGKE
ncbi:MAG: Gfo/Idh/MocA family oxidoreductase [Clostridiales bacterium]|jgi:predicted dehydrogenase|nr:Gfo/Idh/MocA family oxidoreductase [Clostridiales bacterium]